MDDGVGAAGRGREVREHRRGPCAPGLVATVLRARLREAFPDEDSAAREVRGTIDNLQDTVLPQLERQIGNPTSLTLGGVAPEDRDFVQAVYGNFPYVLAFVILLTLVLLMRAFRSVFLPLKAVVLNLLVSALEEPSTERKPGDPEFNLDMDSKDGRVHCFSPGNRCAAPHLVRAKRLSHIHDEGLAKATEEINAILDETAARRPSRSLRSTSRPAN